MSAGQPFRLPDGGAIDRERPVAFSFNGRPYRGFDGDTLAAALLANGVRVVSRSFKYHRPRGIFSAGEEEPNALLAVRRGTPSAQLSPLVRTPLARLSPGLVAESQNCFPGVGFDLGRALDFTRVLWPAGFYNKTFKWPGWHWYEGVIRRTAGLGRLPEGEDPVTYHHHNAHCDVLVCGAGPAGLSAALAAARAGARVIIAEQDREAGGSLLADPTDIDGRPAREWIERTLAELRGTSGVRVMLEATVSGYYDHNVLTVVDRSDAAQRETPVKRLWKVRADQVVIASGAIEQPLVFDHNDRPGIMLAGAIREYANRYAVVPGRRVALATNNDEAYRTAFLLDDRGVQVPAIMDTRRESGDEVREEARRRGINVHEASAITDTRGTKGLRSVAFRASGSDRRIDCDALAVSGGWNPTVHLYSQAGGTLRYDDSMGCFVPGECHQAVRTAGAASGGFDLRDVVLSGWQAGAGAAADAGFASVGCQPPAAEADGPVYGMPGPRLASAGDRSRQWIDLQHDVTAADIELAVRENFVSVEHMKRYTTVGMSVDQGKTSNLNALTLLAELTGKPVGEVGTTTFRPQYMPVPMGVFAGPLSGELYAPARLMPGHAWHERAGAVFDDYGGWKRPAWYAPNGAGRDAAIGREVLAVRSKVGLFDGSPLGKIEVAGPDAAEFLNRVYVNNALTLVPGRVRYGLMLTENGIIMDDGVFACLGDGHYLVSTTAANGDRVAAWLDEWHQCEWPDLELVIAPVTTQWAVLTLAGPNARALLSELECDIDLSGDAMPHMSIRTGTVEGWPARIQRVSFSGEASYEVGIPADRADSLLEKLAAKGDAHGLVPTGIEAVLVLRMEKGYLHVGADTDGTTNPIDVGFGRVVGRKQGDYVGRRSLERPHDLDGDRRRLVGIEPVDGCTAFPAGAHIVAMTNGVRRSQGFVTSACVSPTLGKPIGLAMLERGNERKGELAHLFDRGRLNCVRIVDPVFYDPEGERLHG